MIEFWNSLDSYEQFYIIVLLCFIPVMILGIITSVWVRSTFKKYERITAQSGVPAFKAARDMLNEAGLHHVPIQRTGGYLTDHYDPRSDSVALSEPVYASASMAAIGVACHEAGHAIQHARGYFFSKLRLSLVPAVNIANRTLMPIMIIGMILGFLSYGPLGNIFVIAGLILFGLSALFSLVTLPTEFNASARALESIKRGNYSRQETAQAKKILRAAAMTYVAAFLMSLIQFLRFVAIFLMSSRRRR